jgi:hypothetical protein
MDLPRPAIAAYRLGFGTLALSALTYQFLLAAQKPGFNPVNFFSFFTNLSNILGAVVLIACALSARFARTKPGDLLRGAATVYLAVTFVVYWLLLNEITESLGIVVPWVNLVVHTIMPIVMLVDWLLNPPGGRLAWRSTGWWLAFPLIYFGYSVVRGASVGWYPYPFLNPALVGGLVGVAAYAAAMTLAFAGASAIMMWIAQPRGVSRPQPG